MSTKGKGKRYIDFFSSGKNGALLLFTLLAAWLLSGIVKAYFSPIPVVVCYFIALILVLLVSEVCFWLTRLLFQNRRRLV